MFFLSSIKLSIKNAMKSWGKTDRIPSKKKELEGKTRLFQMNFKMNKFIIKSGSIVIQIRFGGCDSFVCVQSNVSPFRGYDFHENKVLWVSSCHWFHCILLWQRIVRIFDEIIYFALFLQSIAQHRWYKMIPKHTM